jgi:hypothetical protein
LAYKPGVLRIDCNELGFTGDNVEAICGISQSTKSGKTSDGQYIGEKGIGFKSVFKAADVVWISSQEYTFKFDKSEFLGMIAPFWTNFPETTLPGYTSFYLQLSKDFDEEALVRKLVTFDTNLLIFLRRVKEINIQVSLPDESVRKWTIQRSEYYIDGEQVVVLKAGQRSFRYLMRSHISTDLPETHQRPNWPQSKVLLAFPLMDLSEKPQPTPQNVYAFLPIRNYGLKVSS